MLPRHLLLRGGIATLQLRRLTISNLARTTIFRGAALTSGNASSGPSVFSVRYGSSDSKDSDGKSKKSKKLKKKDWDLKDKRDDKDKDKKYRLRKDSKYQFKEKEKEKKERDEERDEEEEGEDQEEVSNGANAEGKTVVDLAKEDKNAPVEAVGRGASATTTIPESEVSKVEQQSAVINDSNLVKPTPVTGEATKEPRPAEPEESKVEQESAVVNPPSQDKSSLVGAPEPEPEDSKVEQQSAVVNDSNPPKPTSVIGEATKVPRSAEPEESKVEQESAVVNPPAEVRSVSAPETEESKVEKQSAVVNDFNPPKPTSVIGEATKVPRSAEPEESKVEQESAVVNPPTEVRSVSAPETEESKVEQQSAVVNDFNPPKPISVIGEATKVPRPAEPEESKVEQESTIVNPSSASNLTSAETETVKVAPEDEIDFSPRSEEVSEKALDEGPKGPSFSSAPDFYQLIASNPISYANPNHLGRQQQPPSTPPQGASPPSPSSSSYPPPPPSRPPPSIPDASHPTPPAFPTITLTTPKPQPITFASTRLNTPMTTGREGSEKPVGKEQKEEMVVGGVKVPPKPEEPDNCCMSGCVNCVWDLYREELEHYTTQKLLAQQIQLQTQSPTPTLTSTPNQTTFISPQISPISRLSPGANISMSMDDDGVVVKADEREWLDNEDIPVGIRAFMATEKRLRERRKERESRL